MAFAYSVAIRLTVANLASQGVRLLAKDLLAAHGNAVNLGDKLKALKLAAVGYGMEKTGEGMLGMLGKAVDASKEYTHQIALMNAAGMTQKEIAGSVAAAWNTSRSVITSSATENLAAIRELRSVFGRGEGMQHAYAVLPTVQRASAVMQSLTGKEQPNVAFDMVKAIEFGTKGAITQDGMLRQAEMMTKALIAFQGTLSVADFHATLKASKSAAPFLSDEFKYTVLPTIMQEMKSGHGGAQAAGTAIATLFGTIKGQAIQTRMIPAWIAGGLIDRSKVVADPYHKTMSKLLPGAVMDADLFTKNPLLWAQKDLIPARDRLMQKYHVDEIGAYYSLTGNRNSAFMMQTLVNKGAQIARDQQLINSVGSSYSGYRQLLKADPQMAEMAMQKQWNNVLSIIGYQILPILLPGMLRFAVALGSLSRWMKDNSGTTKALAIGFGVIGVALIGIGKALMFAGIIKFLGLGPMLAGLAARMGVFMLVAAPWIALMIGVGVAAYEAYKHWDAIKAGLSAAWNAIYSAAVSFINGIINLANKLPFVHIAPIEQPKPSNFVHGGGTQPVQVHTQVNIDGKKVAQAVSQHQAKSASAPNTGLSTFNPGWSVMRPATAR